jgi:hypothetical protein
VDWKAFWKAWQTPQFGSAKVVKASGEPPSLREQLDTLRGKRRFRDRLRVCIWVFSIFIGLLFAARMSNELKPPNYSPIELFFVAIVSTSFYPLVFEIFYLRNPSKEEIQELQGRVELLEDLPEQQRAERLFKLHQLELKKYYDQALSQSRWIFYVGLACLVLGFLIIWGAYRIITGNEIAHSAQKTIVAVVGAIGSLLSSYIGAIYMKMYTETLKSLTAFHNRLVRTHHMHYGAYLAARISDDTKLLNVTLSKMALATVSTHAEATAVSDSETEGASSDSGESIRKLLEDLSKLFPDKKEES